MNIIHVIRPRGYQVCLAVMMYDRRTIRALPLLHGPVTVDGKVGYDFIDREPLPRLNTQALVRALTGLGEL